MEQASFVQVRVVLVPLDLNRCNSSFKVASERFDGQGMITCFQNLYESFFVSSRPIGGSARVGQPRSLRLVSYCCCLVIVKFTWNLAMLLSAM